MSTPAKLLVIGKVWPEPKSSAAGLRILQIINIFREKGYDIIFCSAAVKNEFSFDLETISIETRKVELNSSSFDKLISNIDPAFVLYDRYMTEEQFGWRVTQNAPNAIQILDTEDLHFLRHAREECLKEGQNPLNQFNSFLNNEIMVRELASIFRCDLSIMISKFEIELLENEFNLPSKKFLYLPLLVDKVDQKKPVSVNEYHERFHFVTIGNFLHPPNRDSVNYLKEYIWPKIREELPTAELHIFGAYPDDRIMKLSDDKEGFLIKGRAEDVFQTLQNYRVMLAPLRFGAGQKGKLLDAMIAGLPSVCSKIAAEAMQSEKDWPGYICDSDAEFIEKSISLYQSETKWKNKNSNIDANLSTSFDLRTYSNAFWESFSSLDFQEMRSKDYLASLLKYQSNHATKYLSKWIEEKSRRKYEA